MDSSKSKRFEGKTVTFHHWLGDHELIWLLIKLLALIGAFCVITATGVVIGGVLRRGDSGRA